MKSRLKNPYFWLGLGGVIFSSAGIDFKTLTSWNLLGEALLSILANPVAVVAVIAALVGVCVDPSSKGLKDNK
ncbi:MAG: phage holin [Paraclostridium sordellii]|uniref:Holin, phage phi lc3 family n=1 Tax=Paraclostridium sordellii TaxID=1505 RepID=A0ABM9RTK7_PARSO|nr:MULTISPECIES: phage holin [Clostridia]EPZ61773.1 holin, phage phi LC3 family [[Clostridium] sordellii ATCC 9714] [Paeniclostridium sordellii ATCC 9714]AUN12773.1 phage holin [Paeniclostridium sordellii]MCQ4699073.1 phage holin [Paeniclostridium sordellii]MDU4477934.1 phage holin [Clostridium sp.]MDU7965394.1 phage holin [Paeniclostridium sordellii]